MLTSATRGEMLTLNPNECNSTLTSGTSGIIYTRNTNVQSLILIASQLSQNSHFIFSEGPKARVEQWAFQR